MPRHQTALVQFLQFGSNHNFFETMCKKSFGKFSLECVSRRTVQKEQLAQLPRGVRGCFRSQAFLPRGTCWCEEWAEWSQRKQRRFPSEAMSDCIEQRGFAERAEPLLQCLHECSEKGLLLVLEFCSDSAHVF
eukprot:s194_g9.t1